MVCLGSMMWYVCMCVCSVMSYMYDVCVCIFLCVYCGVCMCVCLWCDVVCVCVGKESDICSKRMVAEM